MSRRAYYDWLRAPAKLITAETLHLHRRIKELFNESRKSMGSRLIVENLRKEGIKISRYRVRKMMKRLGLRVRQRQAYRVTTDSSHLQPVASNILDRQFNPGATNQAWASDITYLPTAEGWLYLAVIIDMNSRRVIGWKMDRLMNQALVNSALEMAIKLRNPSEKIIHHSDRGSQYASKSYQHLLKQHGFTCSMSRKGNCWDNAVVERFFGSLKHEWLANIRHLKRETMMSDVYAYIRYYNGKRLHTALGFQTPIEHENSLRNVCGLS